MAGFGEGRQGREGRREERRAVTRQHCNLVLKYIVTAPSVRAKMTLTTMMVEEAAAGWKGLASGGSDYHGWNIRSVGIFCSVGL